MTSLIVIAELWGYLLCSVCPVCSQRCLVSEMMCFILNKEFNRAAKEQSHQNQLARCTRERRAERKAEGGVTIGEQHLGERGLVQYGPGIIEPSPTPDV